MGFPWATNSYRNMLETRRLPKLSHQQRDPNLKNTSNFKNSHVPGNRETTIVAVFLGFCECHMIHIIYWVP